MSGVPSKEKRQYDREIGYGCIGAAFLGLIGLALLGGMIVIFVRGIMWALS